VGELSTAWERGESLKPTARDKGGHNQVGNPVAPGARERARLVSEGKETAWSRERGRQPGREMPIKARMPSGRLYRSW